jgi:hypothetical protein
MQLLLEIMLNNYIIVKININTIDIILTFNINSYLIPLLKVGFFLPEINTISIRNSNEKL